MSARTGWWVDHASLAHFYDSAEELDAEIHMVYPLCGAENREGIDPREYLHLPDEVPPRPWVDMGSAKGMPCPECLKRLESPR